MPNDFSGYTEITDPEILAEVKTSEAAEVKAPEITEITDPAILDEVRSVQPEIVEITDPAILDEAKTADREQRYSQARRDILADVESRGLGASFKNAMSKNFSLKRNEEGKLEIPITTPTPEKGDSFLEKAVSGTALLLSDIAGSAGITEDKFTDTFDRVKQTYALTDEDETEILRDLKKAYGKWGEGEKTRMLSDRRIILNPSSKDILEPEKLAAHLEQEYGGVGRIDEFMASLPQRQKNLSSNLLGAYEAAASVAKTMEKTPAGLVNRAATGSLLSPSEYAESIGETNLATPEFIRRYETEVLDKQGDVGKFVRGLSVDTVMGWNKLATTALGIGGLLGSESMGELAAETSEAGSVIGQGKADTGLVGAAVQEAPSIVSQIVLGGLTSGLANAALGSGAAAQAITTGSTLLTAGAQSAGMTYADQIASGASPEEAQKNALLAGTSTALITGIMSRIPGFGGVESVAAGKKVTEVTIRDLFRSASKQELWQNTRGFAADLLKSTVGEATEEGIDQLASKFLTADADTDLSTAWSEAWEAAKVGGFIGGAVAVGQGAMGAGRDPASDLVDDGSVANVGLSTPIDETSKQEVSATRLRQHVSKRRSELERKRDGEAAEIDPQTGQTLTIAGSGIPLNPEEEAELDVLTRAEEAEDYTEAAKVYGVSIKPVNVVTPKSPAEQAVEELTPKEDSAAPASAAAVRDTVPASILTPEERELTAGITEPETVAPEAPITSQEAPYPATPEQLKAEMPLLSDEQALVAAEFGRSAFGLDPNRIKVGSGLPRVGQPTAPASAPTQEPEVKTSESGAQYTEGVTKKGTPKITWTRTKNGRSVGDEWNEGFAERAITEDNTSTKGFPSEYKVTTISQIINGDKGEVELATRDMTPEEMKAKRAKLEKENQQRREMGFKELPIPEIPTQKTPITQSPQKTEVPTGSLPEGQTPTSGDVGVPQITSPDTSSVTQAATTVSPATPPTAKPSVSTTFQTYAKLAGRKPSRRRQELAFMRATDTLLGETNVEARKDLMEYFTGRRPRGASGAGISTVRTTFKAWLDNGGQELPKTPRRPVTMRKDSERVAKFKESQVARGIQDYGGILSKSAAVAQGNYAGITGQWDDAPVISDPAFASAVYNPTGGTPDQVAQFIFDNYEGALSEPTAQALWAAIGAETTGAGRMAKQEAREDERLAQAEAFQIAMEADSDSRVAMSELAVGDKIVMSGEELEVTSRSVDEDGYVERTVLKGGAKFGTQIVSGDITLPVESVEIAERVDEGFAPEFEAGQREQRPTKAQRAKGTTTLERDGTITIEGNQAKADFSTAIHELTHAFEFSGFPTLTDSQVAELKSWAGDDTEGRKAMKVKGSEKLARGFENYVASGRAPLPSLQALFDKMAKWMLDIYGKFSGSDIDVDIPENIRAIFDSIASRIDPLVFTTMQERVDNPTTVESDAGVILSTDDGSPLPPAVAPTERNIEMIGEANPDEAINLSISIVKGMLEVPVPPAPTYPELTDDWNPDNLYSLQERRALEEAEQYGFSTDWKQAQRTFKENFARAYAAEEEWQAEGRPDTAGTALIDRIEREGSDAVLSDQDIAHLTIEGFRRKIELDKALTGLTDALQTDSAEQLESAQLRHDAANQAYQQVLNLAARARTASGRSLNAWKQAIREDFSPATLFTRQLARWNANRMKNGEKPVKRLPEEEIKKIIAYSERMLRMEAALRNAKEAEALPADERQEYEDRLAEQDALIEELLAEKAQSRKGRSVQEATKRALTDRIKQAAAEARERLKAAGETVRYQLEADETPEEKARWFDKVLVMAEPYIVDTAMSSARFADLVKARLGQSMVAVAEKLRIDVDRYVRTTEADITGREVPSVEKIQGELNPNIPVTRELVYDLAKAHIFEGARKSEVMDRVTATLQTTYPGITREEASQLFTDYGRQIALKPDELAKALRTAKSVELVQKQIDDLTARKTMMKTGRAKDEADIALRELRKKRDDLAKQIGYNPTNPATQLASAQSAAKRRMENEIAELTQAIELGEPRVRVRRGVEYTEEMTVLRDELAELRESYNTIFGRERTDAERNAMLIKDLDMRIAKEEDLISRGLLTEPAPNQPTFSESPEVLARREKLAELRQRNRDLHAPEIALNKALTAARKAIENRQATIERGGRPREKKAVEPLPYNQELDSLWKAADAMDDYIKELRRNMPLTPAQQLKAMQDAYDRAVQARENLKQRIAKGELEVQKPARKIPLEERTRRVRQENAELQKQITQMQRDAKLGQFSDEAKEARRVGGLEARIAELRRKRAAKDFTKKPRREPISNERIRDLELTISMERNAYDNERAEAVFNDMKTWAKLKTRGVGFLRSIQAFNLSGDVGVIFRTLGPAMGTIIATDIKRAATRFWNKQPPETVSKPFIVQRMVQEGWKALMDERNQIAVYEEIFKHPDYPKMKRRGFKLLSPHETTFELNPDDTVRVNPVKLVTNKMILALTLVKAGVYVAALATPAGWLAGGALLVAKPSFILKEVGKIIAAGAALAGANRLRIAIERANNTIVNVARWELSRATMEAYPDMANDEKFMDDMMRTTMLFSGQFTGTGATAKKIEQNTAFLGQYIAYINHNISKASVAFGIPLFRIGLAKRDRRALTQAATMYRNDLALTASRIAIMATVVGMIFGDDEEDEETVMGVVLDVRSPHFLSVKLGDKTFVDVTASRTKWWKQAFNLLNSEGLERDALRDGFVVPEEREAKDKAEAFGNFVAGLLAPNKKTFVEFAIKRRTREGGNLDEMNFANNLDVLTNQVMMNLTLRDLQNIYEEHGAFRGSILAQYMFFGDSVQIRDTTAEREEKTALEKEREAIPEWFGEDN